MDNALFDPNKSVEFLKNRGFQVVLLNKIEKLSEITALCLSKSYLRTENYYRICDIYSDNLTFENILFDEEFSSLSEIFLFCLASNVGGGKENQTRIDISICKSIQKTKLDYFNRLNEIKHTFEFNSIDKISGNIREFNGELQISIMGMAKLILNKSTRILRNGSMEEIDDSALENILKKINEYEKNYKKVYGLAIRDVPIGKDLEDISLEDLGFCFVGLYTITEDFYPNSKFLFQQLEKLNIKPILITTDHVEPTFAMMKQLKLITETERINIIQGGYNGQNEDGERKFYNEIFTKNRVAFSRQTPSNIAQIVNYLKEKGEKVAFIGDGTNEVPALLKSDIAIGTKDSTDIAASVSHFIFTENEILPKIIEVFDYFKRK